MRTTSHRNRHTSPAHYNLTTFSLTRNSIPKLFCLYDHLCGHDATRHLVSDYSPVLNQYTTQITAVVIGNLISYFVHHLWKQRRTQIQHRQSFHDHPGSLAYFYNFGVPAKGSGYFINLLFFQKIKDFRCYPSRDPLALN
jgi:hypothetical protein